jgi:hypothetical protein
MNEEMDTNDLEDTVSDEENDPDINGVKNDNIDDGTIVNQNDVLRENGSEDMDDSINASNENMIVNHNEESEGALTANKLVSKNIDNLREAEERTHEVPLRTENTDRVEDDNQ